MIFVSLFTAQPQHLLIPILLSTRIRRYGTSARDEALLVLIIHEPGLSFLRTNVRFAPIVLKKSFFTDDRKFSGPLMRLSRCEVRDHINCRKNDRWR